MGKAESRQLQAASYKPQANTGLKANTAESHKPKAKSNTRLRGENSFKLQPISNTPLPSHVTSKWEAAF